jgi:hypothetical protein
MVGAGVAIGALSIILVAWLVGRIAGAVAGSGRGDRRRPAGSLRPAPST